MRCRAAIVAGASLVAATARASDDAGVETRVELTTGAATTPFFTRALPEASGRGAAVVGSGSWRAARGFSVGLSVPLVLVRLREPLGTRTDEPAWGNPLFWGERRVVFAEGRSRIEGWLRLGVGAPLADSGAHGTLTKNRSLAVADAIGGFQSREFFAPGVVPIAVTTGVSFESRTFRCEGSVKLVPMLRIDDAYLPEGSARVFALSALVSTGGTVWLYPELGLGARAWLVIDAQAQADAPRARTLGLVLSPALSFRLGARAKWGTAFVVPVAGALGGSAIGFDARAAVEW